jgi:hypothetical protein
MQPWQSEQAGANKLAPAVQNGCRLDTIAETWQPVQHPLSALIVR